MAIRMEPIFIVWQRGWLACGSMGPHVSMYMRLMELLHSYKTNITGTLRSSASEYRLVGIGQVQCAT
jgi:hypothetical protein